MTSDQGKIKGTNMSTNIDQPVEVTKRGENITSSGPFFPNGQYSGHNETIEPVQLEETFRSAAGSSVNFDPISISWHGINVHSKPSSGLAKCSKGDSKPVHIIKNVTGHLDSGNLLAIIGASGAGKTTLLNVLTGRNLKNAQVRGNVLLNGQPASIDKLTSCSAYVQQDDLFIGILTVREHLLFQAHLRSNTELNDHEAGKKVDNILFDLGLTKVADSRIHDPNTGQFISGGEMKRLSIASEILTDPSILFCDEPTSGIDSFMAQSVVSVLQSMANSQRTVICTIHQPSSEIFSMFSKILLLVEGRVAYMGDAQNALTFFQQNGFKCPDNYNPADFYIQQLAIVPSREQECRKKVNAICDSFDKTDLAEEYRSKAVMVASENGAGKMLTSGSGSPVYRRSVLTQFKWVFWRCIWTNLREPMLTTARIVNVIFSAILVGVVYWRQKYDQEGIMNINGAIFLLIANSNFSSIFLVTNTFCLEMPIFFREHGNGLYRVSVYFWAKLIAELPYFILLPPILMGLSYWMIGMYADTEVFLYSLLVMILVTNAASGFGYLVSSISSSVQMALEITSPLITPLFLFGGAFLNNRSIPSFLVWMKYLSWFYYGNEILTVNQWRKVTNITCNYDSIDGLPSGGLTLDLTAATTDVLTMIHGDPSPPSSACIPDGKTAIRFSGFSEDYVNRDLILLFAVVVFFRFLSWVALWVKARLRR